MISEPNDAEVFQQHTENMKNFRYSHYDNKKNDFSMLNQVPAPSKTGYQGRDIKFFNAKGTLVIVPIWKIELVEGSQN
jgi:hypothetical protein